MAFENYYKENRPIADDYIYYVIRPDDYENEEKMIVNPQFTNREYSILKQGDDTIINDVS